MQSTAVRSVVPDDRARRTGASRTSPAGHGRTVVLAHRHALVAEVLVAALRLAGVSARLQDGRPLGDGEVLVHDVRLGACTSAHLALDGASALTSMRDLRTLIMLLGAPDQASARPSPHAAQQVALPHLTDRERQVLALLSTGASNDAIGAQLGISPHTVRTHVQNLLGKLGADSRLAAAAQARRHGLTRTAT